MPGLLACMEGYRFILDQQASTPTHLVWSDAAESGEWQLHWVILRNANGDPLIGDISQPEVPVLWDSHGSGRWSPQPLFPNLRMLMERIEINAPVLPAADPSLPGASDELGSTAPAGANRAKGAS